jgi:hypothetical protein
MEHLLTLSEDDLYALLVSKTNHTDFYSRDSIVSRGKALCVSYVKRCRTVVCESYRNNGTQISNKIDLACLIGEAIASVPDLAHVPTLPLAALIVKIGLENICRSAT